MIRMNGVHSVFMLRPTNFGFNDGTKNTNPFQNELNHDSNYIASKALAEFDEMVEALENANIMVSVVEDSSVTSLPDAVFLNNWLTILPDKTIHLFPMACESRRAERRSEVVSEITSQLGLKKPVDLSFHEGEGLYLEGTGSIVFDYANRLAYASISERTSETLFHDFCKHNNYKGFSFNSFDLSGLPIYHTNIILSITSKFAIIAADCIENVLERAMIVKSLEQSGKEILYISHNQVANFAGNCLEVFCRNGQSKLVMSRTGFSSLKPHQVDIIKSFSEIILVNISIIERVGGGSARCMMLGAPNFELQ